MTLQQLAAELPPLPEPSLIGLLDLASSRIDEEGQVKQPQTIINEAHRIVRYQKWLKHRLETMALNAAWKKLMNEKLDSRTQRNSRTKKARYKGRKSTAKNHAKHTMQFVVAPML